VAAHSPAYTVLHTETAGAGPPLLLLTTFACGGEAWGVAFERELTRHFFVLRPDWPGTGRSPPAPAGAVTVASLADSARRSLDAYGVAELSIVGWGLGALVALQMAGEEPERVARLALIGGGPGGAGLLARAPTVAALCGVAEQASDEEHMLGLLHRLTSPAWRPFAELFLPQLLPRPAATLAALRGQWSALASWEGVPAVGAISALALLLTGECDRLAPPILAAELAAALPAARLQIVPGAGHALVWEQPAAVAAAIVPFLMEPVQSRHPAWREGGSP
jgi:pimeloyl-ACP methyl ester carboxylesterase